MSKDKIVASVEDGNIVKPKQIQKPVGLQDKEMPLQNQDTSAMTEPNLHRDAILMDVRKRREESQVKSHTVLFVAPSREVHDKCLAPSEAIQSTALALQVDNGSYPENQIQRNCAQEWSGNWFEIMEEDIDEKTVVVSAKTLSPKLVETG